MSLYILTQAVLVNFAHLKPTITQMTITTKEKELKQIRFYNIMELLLLYI